MHKGPLKAQNTVERRRVAGGTALAVLLGVRAPISGGVAERWGGLARGGCTCRT